MRFRRLFATLTIALLCSSAAPAALFAQGFDTADSTTDHSQPDEAKRATLISDRLEIASENRLIASGKVEVFQDGQRLTASRVIYDKSTDRLQIEGPLTLTDATGGVVILASQAELSTDMSEGILQSARVVYDRQLQLAAGNIARVGGRYTAMNNVLASSCKVCAARPTPLWEIRAKRVIHDKEERMIFFENAQFRVAGLPVAYIPRLRLPDPTLDRATGFLAPRLRTTSTLGTGLKLPYFIALGDSRDLTITPYLSTRDSQTIELRYRQAFRTGAIELEGALTNDRLTDDDTRGWFRARGGFRLPEDFRLSFDIQTTSDNAYLLDYGYSDADRLDSRVEVSRVRRNGFFSARMVSFQSLRDDEDNNTLPSLVGDATLQRRFSLGPLGGMGGFRLQWHSHYRTSSSPYITRPAGALSRISDGRDVSRLSARFDWRRSFVSDQGLVATLLGEAQVDAYRLRQDAVFEGRYTRSHAAAGLELRWPLVKAAASGATHVLEPVVQLIGATRDRSGLPNEDSVLVEFDEGNIWSLDRFPGSDAIEQSSRANVGLSWTRYDPAGWNATFTMGKVFRRSDTDNFSNASGLNGMHSDWLLAAAINLPNGISASGRTVIGDDMDPTKAELRISSSNDWLTLSSSALWSIADPQENRPDPTRELTFDAAWTVNPALRAKAEGRYDFDENRGTIAGVGFEYRNECVVVDLSLSRRFTTSASVDPTTSFGLSVDLIGFGSGKAAGPARRCY
ncbi:LPS-assembly protein LptD [Xinfangfangia sp. D13-10-4-6]|uniref:LPS-assembly protein LptD n=1 Tax=Pseudogemmobacter hezensis TaxID=2737662 RepID=UPI0015555CEE|nr:LPS assembly protein LptD [Pseudogemmobacter hezensis]NPD15843.1 LPS-assembly protein LptD [Pseudogemmobacter hezensis]